MLIDLEGHGREKIADVDVSRTIGWFTSLYPIFLDLSEDYDLSRRIKEVKEHLRQVPNKGIGYGILKYLTPEDLKAGLQFPATSRISFNYLGQFGGEAEEKPFTISKESSGNPRSPNGERDHELEITGIIANNRLTMSISYNREQYKSKTMQMLMDNYKHQLVYLISYCTRQETRQLTPSDLFYQKLTLDQLDQLTRQYPVEDILPLSPMQEGIYFTAKSLNSPYAYFEQMVFQLQGDLNIEYIEKSLNQLLKRHEMLRTVFVHEKVGRPLQIVLRELIVDFYYTDIAGIDDPGKKAALIGQFKEHDKQRSFDLGNDVLFRAAIFRKDEADYEFIWSFHHILFDGWCLGILISDFFEIYNSYLEGRPCQLPPLKQFRDYLTWLAKQDTEVSEEFWSNYLGGYETAAVIPPQHVPTYNQTGYKHEQVIFPLGKAITAALHQLAGENQVTQNIVFQAIWGIILGKYNNRNDVVFGFVVSGRSPEIEGVESMVGLFINSLPLRVTFEENTTFRQLLQRLREDTIAMNRHQYLPLTKIQALSPLKQHLIHHAVVFENYPAYGGAQNSIPVKLSNLDVFEQGSYDLFLVLKPGEQLVVNVEYNGNAYTEAEIDKIASHIEEVIGWITMHNETAIKDIKLSLFQEVLLAEQTFLEEEAGDFRL